MPPSSCAKEISGGGRQYAADCWRARRRPRIPQNAIGTVAAALHATSAEENRDATFDAGTEALHLFKCWAFFAGEALRGFLSATLRNAGHLHSFFLTHLQVLLAEESPVGTEGLGHMAEGLAVIVQHRLQLLFIRGIPVQHFVVRD